MKNLWWESEVLWFESEEQEVNKTRREYVRNKEITRTVGTTTIVKFTKTQRLKLFGHLLNMNPKSLTIMILETTRGRFRPRRRWIEVITDTLRLHIILAHQMTKIDPS
jgi:hypothetical protein